LIYHCATTTLDAWVMANGSGFIERDRIGYLGGYMPFVSIRIVREVLGPDPAAKKAAISGAVARAIAEATGLPASDVSIVFEEVEARNWYVGEVDVETRRRALKSGQAEAPNGEG
jgi:4-oxalocrotonate tautomerase